MYHHILSAYYYATGDMAESLFHLEVNLDGIDKESLVKRVEGNKYISALTNAIYIADKIGEHRKSVQYLSALKEFALTTKSNEDLSIKLFSSISSIELSIYLRKGDFEKANVTAQKVTDKLQKYGDKIVPVRRAFLEYKMDDRLFLL